MVEAGCNRGIWSCRYGPGGGKGADGEGPVQPPCLILIDDFFPVNHQVRNAGTLRLLLERTRVRVSVYMCRVDMGSRALMPHSSW